MDDILYDYLLYEGFRALIEGVEPCIQCNIGVLIQSLSEPLTAYCDHCGAEYANSLY